MEDIDELDLDDEDWTRNLTSVVEKANSRQQISKKRKQESPRSGMSETGLVERGGGILLTLPGPAGRDRLYHASETIHIESDALFPNTSWKTALRKILLKTKGEAVERQIHQMVQGRFAEKSPKMIVFVMNMVANGNGSMFAQVKDASGEMGCAFHYTVFKKFPNLKEKCTIFLNKVT